MEEKRSYSIDPELIHYGVPGMKWKNHKYRSNLNGEYLYDQNFRPSDRPGTYKRYRNPGRVVSNEDRIRMAQRAQRQKMLRAGAQRRQSNSGYGARTQKDDSDYYNFRESDSSYGSSADRSRSSKYDKYVKKTETETSRGKDINTDVTYVKRGKKKRLVTKKTDMGYHKLSGMGSNVTTTYTKVDPGRYDSYGDAARGETKRAVRAVKKSARNAYKVGSCLKDKAAKKVKSIKKSTRR